MCIMLNKGSKMTVLQEYNLKLILSEENKKSEMLEKCALMVVSYKTWEKVQAKRGVIIASLSLSPIVFALITFSIFI